MAAKAERMAKPAAAGMPPAARSRTPARRAAPARKAATPARTPSRSRTAPARAASSSRAARRSAAPRRAESGAACSIDAFGSRPRLPVLVPQLRALGVDVRIALPVRVGRKAARFDLRNHRKLAVVDGRVGYTGSQNMIAADFKPGLTYSELMVRIEGPSALQLQAVFASDWYVETAEYVGDDCFPVPRAAGDVPAQVLPNGPSSSTLPAQRMVVN